MLALQIERPAPAETGPLRPVELPLPEPGPGEVRVRVEACGVCRTDLHEVEGDIRLPRLPLVPGHEVVGVIDTLGPGVDSPAAGTRVGIPWLASTCGRCRFCQSGRENLCDDIRFTGFHVDGGYAEYALARAGFAYPLPAGLDPVAAAPLLCAGVIGLRALRLALPRRPSTGPAPGSCRLGLYGFGASAHLCLQVARHWDCDVAVFTRGEAHRAHALELGAAWAGRAEDRPPWPLDAAVVFAPVGSLVPAALGHLDRGGTLALAGIHSSPIPGFEYALIYDERAVRSVANSTRRDVADLLELATTIPLRTTVEAFPLEKAGAALLALKQGRLRAAAVLTAG